MICPFYDRLLGARKAWKKRQGEKDTNRGDRKDGNNYEAEGGANANRLSAPSALRIIKYRFIAQGYLFRTTLLPGFSVALVTRVQVHYLDDGIRNCYSFGGEMGRRKPRGKG